MQGKKLISDKKGSRNIKCREHMRFYKLIHARKEAYITVIRKKAKQKMQRAYEVLQAYSCKKRNVYHSDQRGKQKQKMQGKGKVGFSPKLNDSHNNL